MKVIKIDDFNTGGNCMVRTLTIENGGMLKMIGINEEGIVGYKKLFEDVESDEDVMFIASNTDELRNLLPPAIVTKCIMHYYYYCSRFNAGSNPLGIIEKCSCGCGNYCPTPPYESNERLYASAYCILGEAKCCSYCGGKYPSEFDPKIHEMKCNCNFKALDGDYNE